jgi:tRNA-Thr(GGU) m(6)t(6)A37 methyltransferase TsaA
MEQDTMDIVFHPIGWIHTPYHDMAPHQPDPEAEEDFHIDLNQEYARGLYLLEKSKFIYVLFYIDRLKKKVSMMAKPPRAGGMEVGLFASRSPRRPNPIGLSTVRLKGIEGNRLHISGIDTLDNTPLLDIKPYMKDLDIKEDANNGWREDIAPPV